MPRPARFLIAIFTGSIAGAMAFAVTVCFSPQLPGNEDSPNRRARPSLGGSRRSFVTVPALSAGSTSGTSTRAPEILMSRQLMELAGVQVGEIVTLAADQAGTRATRFRVVSRYDPTPDPMKFTVKRLEVRVHLPDLIALVTTPGEPQSAESVSALNVALVNPGDAGAVASTLAIRTPGLVARSTARQTDRGDLFAVLERFHWAIAIVTVIGSTAFLLALMVIRAEERRGVIGILRLMGIPARSILTEVLLEGLLIAIAGAAFGILVAAAAQGVVNRFFQWRYDTALVFVRVTFPIASQAVAFAIPLGVIAGLVASWTLLRRDAVSLIRR